MVYVLLPLALLGHLALCVLVVNRIHATALPHWLLRLIDLVWYSLLCGLPLAVIAWLALRPQLAILQWSTLRPAALLYGSVCWLVALAMLPVWYRYLCDRDTTERLISNHTRHLNLVETLGQRPAGSPVTRWLSRLPQNQIFELSIHEKTVCLPRLAPELDGLTIAHLSDLHFTGHVTRAYFDEVVRQTNAWEADLIAVTGDLIDHPQCMDWLTEVLGPLQSRLGNYFVLGNHDLRIHDEQAVRSRLRSAGLIDLGGRWECLQVRGQSILLAGNELPWFTPAADLSECQEIAAGQTSRPLRILLAHTPDQIQWARAWDFDLMLAGHTHGGQICLPLLGPIFAPSRYGVKYAAGTFYLDPTLLHVSRGISGTRYLRFNCPPELTRLTLKAGNPPA